ncbi:MULTISPECIES: FtsX-like permease family protein [unclassified Actinotalea]|uniref:FtsX-like permease family protein n=1 Tax=unclassified Actinotalea TaxID=2638618 RepID=UPI0015F363F1|nr:MULTISPECIES: FtsX-like permease family protein [unclassified Actinotalea]
MTTTAPPPTTTGSRPARRRPAPVRWAQELGLGLRLSTGGDRSGWARLALIAGGIGLGVLALLLAASVPSVLAARDARFDARAIDWTGDQGPARDDTLLVAAAFSDFRDDMIMVVLVQAEGPAAPAPPGVERLPGPGEIVVSPALARLLGSPDGALLEGRWGEEVVGTIGPAGLAGPDEYLAYAGTDVLEPALSSRIDTWGSTSRGAGTRDVLLVLLGAVLLAVLLVPVLIFVATAVRFGGEARDRRLAALRLVGADAAMTRRVAAGETLGGALAGLVVGGALYALVRGAVPGLVPRSLGFFPGDLRPDVGLATLVVVLVPVLAVVATQAALRRVVVEPLGVVRHAAERRRRLWWRPVLPLVGLVLLQPLRSGPPVTSAAQVSVAAGLVVLLLGVAFLLPWLVEATVRRSGAGPVAWELAMRRLQLESGTAVRAVSGVVVAVTGLIALQGMTAAIEHEYAADTARVDRHFDARVTDYLVAGEDDPAARWRDVLAGSPGVAEVDVVSTVAVVAGGSAGTAHVGSCATLAVQASLGSCRDGDVFVVPAAGGARPAAGATLVAEDAPGATWTVPDGVQVVEPSEELRAFGPLPQFELFVTPAAAAGFAPPPSWVTALVVLDPTDADALERLRTTVGRADVRTDLASFEPEDVTPTLRAVREVLLVGTVGLLVVIGASMLVNVVEQLRERRHLLAALSALGTRRRTLGASVMLQVAVPMVLGLVLAAATGTALATALQASAEAPLVVDWRGIGLTTGVAALVVVATTAASLPLLWRLTSPGGLRRE